jgi:alkylhydroperoxidase family enzyme
MAHVTLLDDSDDPKAKALIEQLKAGRRGSLLGIYKALLHNPTLAESWFNHLNAVRWGTSLSGRLREILIIRVGWRLNSAYIMKQHIPKLAVADGLSEDECKALLQEKISEGFSASECAAIRLADELTQKASLSPETAAAIKTEFGERGLVEMSVLVGTYNMHARFVGGLDIELEKD